MVFERDLKGRLLITKAEHSSFSSPYNEKEKQLIAEIFRGNRKIDLFNGENVRLEAVRSKGNSTELILSRARFFDFISSNMLLLNYEKWLPHTAEAEKQLIEREKRLFDADGSPTCFDDILRRTYLSNILAVSVMLSDQEGNYLLTRRNASVAISSEMMSVAVTGSLDDTDFQQYNPVTSCVIRETLEELGLTLDESSITVKKIVAGEKKLQPILLCDAVVPGSLIDVKTVIENGQSYTAENSELIVVTKNRLPKLLRECRFTEAAMKHIELHCPFALQSASQEGA